MTIEQRIKEFEALLDRLIEVACDWRLAWDGTGLSPEARLQRAKGKLMTFYRETLP